MTQIDKCMIGSHMFFPHSMHFENTFDTSSKYCKCDKVGKPYR